MKKELYENYFKGKKVTVLGLGLLGRGVGDTQFLSDSGADIIVTDLKGEKELESSLRALKDREDITYVLNEHRKEDFEGRDFILKAAGVAYDNEYVEHAKLQGIPVHMSAALLTKIVTEHCPATTVIGVTGTRGKSTTTQMIAHILRAANSRVHLGGNIRGIANLPLLDEIEDGDFLLFELDSWQLQGFGEEKISPHIAVFTSFMDDHMNYYKNDKERYFNDKANIYRFQKPHDVLIVSDQAAEEIQKRDKNQDMFVASNGHIDITLLGEHNQVAAKLAYEVASQCGIDDATIRDALQTFTAVEGRLQDVGVMRGVRVINDNNATTPDAVIVGVQSINQTYNRKPILIIGGKDKGLPIDALEKVLQQDVQHVIYLSGTGTDTLKLPKQHEYEKLEDCIAKAFQIAEAGDIILFSPGFASFSKYFNNEYERNDLFMEEIKKYSEKSF